MTRSPGSWCGLAAFGAGGDDGEVHPVVALGEQAPADVGRHLGLGAADERDVAGLQLRPPPGRPPSPRRAQGLDLGRVLAGPERAVDLAGPRERGRGQRGWQVDEEAGPRVVADGDVAGRADEPRHDGRPGPRSRPRAQREHVGPLDHPGRLEPGHDQGGVAVDGHTSIVSRSSGMAS